MARKYKRRYRKKHKKGASVSQVKAIVKREVGKTVETNKMVSYLSWSAIPQLIDNAAGDQQGLLLSLTGGVSPQLSQTVITPGTYNDKQLFTLLPSGSELTAGTGNTNQASQGGVAMEQTPTGTIRNDAIGGIHCLEGRQAYLKSWYASIILSNVTQQVSNPRPCFVRMIVFQTRRPLAQDNLAQQIFLQNQAVVSMESSVQAPPETVNSYLNMDIIKKVFYNKLVKLTGPATADGGDAGASSAQLYCNRFRVRINKKCRWTYYYSTEDPAQSRPSLSYMGPFIYAVFLSNQADDDKQPAIAMNTMLTFQDD